MANLPNAKTWAGIDNLLVRYMQVSPTDTLVIVYSPECRDVAAWITIAARRQNLNPVVVGMAALEDPGLPARLRDALPWREDVHGILQVLTIERDSMSHYEVFRDLRSAYGAERCKITRIISGSEEMLSKAMTIEPETISAYNAFLLKRLRAASSARITTPSGTDLQIDFNHDRYTWTSNRGMSRTGGFLILPPGEVATYPALVNGTLVADAAFNVNVFTQLDARLREHPVTVEVADSAATSFHCPDPSVTRLLELCWNVPDARRVGELGFGTNTAVDELVAMNSHINERVPGVHIGFGQHNQDISKVGYNSKIHLDLIARGGTVFIDDGVDAIDLSRPISDGSPHPDGVNDEDIDGDCCALSFEQCELLGTN